MEFSKNLLTRIKLADNVLFFTGAGISAESGISTFRGTDGIWNKLKSEELANFNAFLKNPDMVWEWYQLRRSIVEESKPNAGHIAIVECESLFNSVTVVTQNVDDLHNSAGSKKVLELHGNIVKNYCIKCKARYDNLVVEDNKKVPKCTKCGGLIRPDIVWFGEILPQDVFDEAEKAAKKCDVCFVVGTSAVVFPAANIPIIAKQYGALVVEVNLTHTDISSLVDETLLGPAGEVLPKLIEAIKNFN